MSRQTDDGQAPALLTLAGVIALTVGGVLALAIWRHSVGVDLSGAPLATPAAAGTLRGEAGGRIEFEVGSIVLPADAESVIGQVADAARGDATRVVLISGAEDASVAAQRLERQRVEAVRHALEADGVSPEQLIVDLARPAIGNDARDMSSVELRLR